MKTMSKTNYSLGYNQFCTILLDCYTYEKALPDLRRCFRLNSDGWWLSVLDDFAVSDDEIRDYYAEEAA